MDVVPPQTRLLDYGNFGKLPKSLSEIGLNGGDHSQYHPNRHRPPETWLYVLRKAITANNNNARMAGDSLMLAKAQKHLCIKPRLCPGRAGIRSAICRMEATKKAI